MGGVSPTTSKRTKYTTSKRATNFTHYKRSTFKSKQRIHINNLHTPFAEHSFCIILSPQCRKVRYFSGTSGSANVNTHAEKLMLFVRHEFRACVGQHVFHLWIYHIPSDRLCTVTGLVLKLTNCRIPICNLDGLRSPFPPGHPGPGAGHQAPGDQA